MRGPVMQYNRCMETKCRPPVFARPKDHQFCRLPDPWTNRPQLGAAQTPVGRRQNIRHTFGPVDHVQVSFVAQPPRRGINPSAQRRVDAHRPFPARILRAVPGGAIKIGRIGQNMVKALIAERDRQRSQIRLHHIKPVTHCKLPISRLPFDAQQPQARNARAQTQGRRPNAAAQIQHRLPRPRRHRCGQQDRINTRPIPLSRLPQMQLAAQKRIMGQISIRGRCHCPSSPAKQPRDRPPAPSGDGGKFRSRLRGCSYLRPSESSLYPRLREGPRRMQ
mmetsp:Transcript_23690/g.42308  ORF Transcript_23690/g.42308 Transcript_23690/m.42308 type:complete len:277 (-) Transcript_23690:2969-3799(-)